MARLGKQAVFNEISRRLLPVDIERNNTIVVKPGENFLATATHQVRRDNRLFPRDPLIVKLAAKQAEQGWVNFQVFERRANVSARISRTLALKTWRPLSPEGSPIVGGRRARVSAVAARAMTSGRVISR